MGESSSSQPCWEIRPCDDEMQSRCAHAQAPERCPTKCVFGQCHRPQRRLVEDFTLMACVMGDCEDAIKDECLFCEVYLKTAAKRAG